ncbi:MAG: ribosome maturation factor RimM [Cellulomonas sp.]|nr:ribosome maturation factor RimM [Cellulomonas sp.]
MPATAPSAAGPPTIAQVRPLRAKWFDPFAEAVDRSGAEALRGVELLVESVSSDEDDAWYPHELAGLRAEHVDGRVLGTIAGLEHLPAHDMLVLVEESGARTLVPFVSAIVPVVDVPGGRVVLDPPGGLLASDAANLVISDETVGPLAGTQPHADPDEA